MPNRLSFSMDQAKESMSRLGMSIERVIATRRGSVLVAKDADKKNIVKIADRFKEDTEDQISPARSVGIKNEAEIISNLGQGICPNLTGFYETNNLVISVLEYINGQKINSNSNIEQIKNFTRRLILKVSELHAHNVVHGDVQPDNILCFYQEDGGLIDLRLIDFEFAKNSDNPNKTYPGLYHFLSPSVAQQLLTSDKCNVGISEETFSVLASCLSIIKGGRYPVDYSKTAITRKERLKEIAVANYTDLYIKQDALEFAKSIINLLNCPSEERPRTMQELQQALNI